MDNDKINAAETGSANEIDTEKLSDRDVTIHTAAMWKYNPVPENPEPYPEYLCGGGSEGCFGVIGASVRGKKHKHDGSNRDDAFEYAFLDGAVIAAVADGAGSKPFSRIGAKAACEAAINYVNGRLAAIKRNIPDYREKLGKPIESAEFGGVCSEIAGMLRDSCAEAFAAVEAAFEKRRDIPEFEEAIGRKPDIKDFSSTLLAAAVIPVDTENGREYLTAAIQLGDGMIAAFDDNADFGSALIVLGGADSGSFAGETEFLTSEQARSADSLMNRTKIRRGRMTSLMLMTDGVADDYYPNNPQLLRLALDLKLNGILPVDGAESTENSVEDLKIPEPVAYPWVNDSDVKYSLQYVKNLLSESGLTLKQIWENKDIQRRASLKAFDIIHDREPKEMLQIWLDNYVERGSFDDRTLLAVTVSKEFDQK